MEIVINGRFLTQSITGVQRYARELVQALDGMLPAVPGVEITVMCPHLAAAPPAWRNIELRQVGRLQGHAWEQLELPWCARGATLFCPGNTAPALSLLGDQKVVVTVHDLSYRYFPDAYRLPFRLWYGFIVPLALRRARTVITVSESERRAIIANYPAAATRLHAVANGGTPSVFSAKGTQETARDHSTVLYVGSLSKRKNFPRLLEAACRLARHRGFHFIFVGDAAKSFVVAPTSIPADVASKITFVGAVDDAAVLLAYYRKATCLLFPSLYEASPFPPIEAMTCECPVIASDIPALRERCGDAAVYCDPYDVESIVAATERVIDDAALRASLQALGRQRAATITWERCARETLKLICGSSSDRGFDALT
jgi:glycosyltransferase involved in cell wall biosynthesis